MLRAVVVDDEKHALNMLARLLKESDMVEVIGCFSNPLEAIEFLELNKADVIFLDIEMPDMSGLELSNYIIGTQKSASIVFVTAYNQYAVEAFELNAIDYIMKPVTESRIKTTLKRIIASKGENSQAQEIKISCFGRFCVKKGLEEVKFRTEKAEELLAFMIDRRGGFISRSEIMDSLWADFDGERALIHFNTTLHYVKKALLQYDINIPFSYSKGGYLFDIRGLNCDYLKFCAFIENPRIPSSDNILEFQETAELFQTQYLSGWDYDWAAVRRLFLERQLFGMLLDMAQFFVRSGDSNKAERWLTAGILMEPLHRELNYRLIEALLRRNEKALAKRHYEIYRSGLQEKLGCEPDKAFRDLLQ